MILNFGDLTIDAANREAKLGGHSLDLTSGEFSLLVQLAHCAGQTLTRRRLIDLTRGEDSPVTDRSIDVQLTHVRRKLGAHRVLIATVRRVGYRFETPAGLKPIEPLCRAAEGRTYGLGAQNATMEDVVPHAAVG
jgi:DNA-binding response OmpR family regulator